jgi:DNA-binding CsgD family transcriptional regulator
VRGAEGEVRDGLELLLPLAKPEGGTEPSIPGTAHVIGELLLRSGDLTGAAEWLGRAAPDAGPAADAPVTVLALPAYADLLRRTGRTEEAGAVLDRAVGLARRFDMPRVLAAATEQRGHLAADDDPERAADLHHRALSIRLGCGLRTYYIDSLDALAVVLLRAERPLDAARLTAATDRARTEIGYPRPLVDGPAHGAALAGLRDALGPDRFGAAWSEGTAMTLDEVVALVRRQRGTRSRPSSGWASLTPTELEVVRLAVEGFSNPAIAERLFIGRGTVKTHLSHVYAKLGIANRTELASFAATRMEPTD